MLEVEDNQVRALRRRRLIERFQDDRATGLGKGAYWSIGTNPDLYARQGGLACRTEAVTVLALVDTRLADFGDVIRNGLVNWGYAICDKSVRGWYRPDLPAAPTGRCRTDSTGWSPPRRPTGQPFASARTSRLATILPEA